MCSKCLGTGHHEEDREEAGMLVAWEVPCDCPAADRWVAELLGYEVAAETAYVSHYYAA